MRKMKKLFCVDTNVDLSLAESIGINGQGFILIASEKFKHRLLGFSDGDNQALRSRQHQNAHNPCSCKNSATRNFQKQHVSAFLKWETVTAFWCNILKSLERKNLILMEDDTDYRRNLEGDEDLDPSEEASKRDVWKLLKDVDTFLAP